MKIDIVTTCGCAIDRPFIICLYMFAILDKKYSTWFNHVFVLDFISIFKKVKRRTVLLKEITKQNVCHRI